MTDHKLIFTKFIIEKAREEEWYQYLTSICKSEVNKEIELYVYNKLPKRLPIKIKSLININKLEEAYEEFDNKI